MLKRQQPKLWLLRTHRRQPRLKCMRIQKIWTHHQTILTKLIGKTYTPQQHLLSLNVLNTYKYTRKLTLTIIQIILFEIWRSRNNIKNDKKLLPQHTLISKIRKELQTIAQAHYKNTIKWHTIPIQRPILHKWRISKNGKQFVKNYLNIENKHKFEYISW